MTMINPQIPNQFQYYFDYVTRGADATYPSPNANYVTLLA